MSAVLRQLSDVGGVPSRSLGAIASHEAAEESRQMSGTKQKCEGGR